MYMTVAQCEAQGGACPRICLDMTPAEVQCATNCYDGCYCAPGFYLLNGSCVPQAECPCYHQGELHPAGANVPFDACNNWCGQPAGQVFISLGDIAKGLNTSSLCHVCLCVCETVPAIMEKWSVGRDLALVSSCISHLQHHFLTIILHKFFFFFFCSGLWLEQLDSVERLQSKLRCWREEALSFRYQSSCSLRGPPLHW